MHGLSKYGFFDRAVVSFLDLVGVYWLVRRYSDRGEIKELNLAPSAEIRSAPSYGLRA